MTVRRLPAPLSVLAALLLAACAALSTDRPDVLQRAAGGPVPAGACPGGGLC